MNKVNYLLQGFGFLNFSDFKKSTFGFINDYVMSYASAFALLIKLVIPDLFGVPALFFLAYTVLIVFEWITGIIAAFDRGEKHESRKLGRMILKVTVYTIPIYILNTMQKQVEFPLLFGFDFNPFVWLYWVVLIVIIWQLFVSLLENLASLRFRFATVLIKIINKRFYKTFDIHVDKRNR